MTNEFSYIKPKGGIPLTEQLVALPVAPNDLFPAIRILRFPRIGTLTHPDLGKTVETVFIQILCDRVLIDNSQ